ncbi:hypothetical protein D9M70_325160 [compost metagenome]
MVGQYRGRFGSRLASEQPEGVVLVQIDAFEALVEARMTTDPVEIDEEQFWHYLEVLPPCSWTRGESESFYMSEFLCGSVTAHLVRLGKRYFKFDSPVIPHHDRVKKVREWLDKQEGEV